MIKFFRHIRKDLMEQNPPDRSSRVGKTGKPAFAAGRYLKYAIGEIILVVIGILIALSINNWNELRKQRSEEIETLKNIKSDFTNVINELEENNAFRERMISTTEIFYTIIHTKQNPYAKKQLDSLMGEFFINPTYNGQSETLNILFNSGKINIISNDSIKNALVIWPTQIEDITEDEIYASNILYSSFMPLVKRYVSLYDIYTNMNFKTFKLFNHTTQTSFMSDYEGLFNDREFEGTLAARELTLSVALIQTRELMKNVKQIIRLIDNDINNLK